jgi:hypothetical protein
VPLLQSLLGSPKRSLPGCTGCTVTDETQLRHSKLHNMSLFIIDANRRGAAALFSGILPRIKLTVIGWDRGTFRAIWWRHAHDTRDK